MKHKMVEREHLAFRKGCFDWITNNWDTVQEEALVDFSKPDYEIIGKRIKHYVDFRH